MNIFKTFIFTVLVPGMIGVFLPYRLAQSPAVRESMPLGNFRYVGPLLIVVGGLIYLWCAWDFATTGKGTPAPIDPPKHLVVKGLYRYVRNPMYCGVLCVVLGQAVWFESGQLFIYAGLGFLIFNLFVLAYEEPVLRRNFGEAYGSYCATVPRWLPALRRRPSDKQPSR